MSRPEQIERTRQILRRLEPIAIRRRLLETDLGYKMREHFHVRMVGEISSAETGVRVRYSCARPPVLNVTINALHLMRRHDPYQRLLADNARPGGLDARFLAAVGALFHGLASYLRGDCEIETLSLSATTVNQGLLSLFRKLRMPIAAGTADTAYGVMASGAILLELDADLLRRSRLAHRR